ncbi:MAG: hypothetical protein S4CHLAM7_13660 [Chlamydiae bacterium]|nr:hypothetical protein [Chlamydiota bacterium]
MTNPTQKNRKKIIEELKPFFSEETGYLQLNPHIRPYKKSDVIPVAMNLLYILIMLRTKDRFYIEQALTKLEHLLYFQSKEGDYHGNFPVFLHHYPRCERYLEIMDALFPMYWIMKEFSTILVPKLKIKLYKAIEMGMDAINSQDEGGEYSYLLTLERACLRVAIGQLLQDNHCVEKGRAELEKLALREKQMCWGSPRSLAKMLPALELISKESMPKSWDSFWQYLNATWSVQMGTYIGPTLSEYYEGDKAEATLYHLYMEEMKGSELSLKYSPITLLQGELLRRPPNIYVKNSSLSSENLSYALWESYKNEDMAYSLFNIPVEEWVKTGGYFPLKVIFKEKKRVDSFTLQMGSPVKISKQENNDLLLTFEPKVDEEMDVHFFWNLSSKAQISIEGKKATTFPLNKPMQILFNKYTISFSFPDEPKNIWGQILQSNRRTQLLTDDFQTFDTELYFRELKSLDTPFRILLSIRKNN